MNELYSHYVYSTGTHYGNSPLVVHRNRLPAWGFSSLYAVTEETARGIKEAGSTARFAGCVWNERLWLDFDSYKHKEAVIATLKDYNFNFVVYDSGNRGIHVGVLRDASPSHLLPYQDKEWAQAVFPEADMSIYSHLHLFRLPGTVHEVGGRPKEQIYKQDGQVLVLPKWERKDAIRSSVVSGDNAANSSGVSVFESNRVMMNTIPTRNGERHPTLLKLMYGHKEAGTPLDMARWWLQETNKLCETPKSEQELEHILLSVYEAKETF